MIWPSRLSLFAFGYPHQPPLGRVICGYISYITERGHRTPFLPAKLYFMLLSIFGILPTSKPTDSRSAHILSSYIALLPLSLRPFLGSWLMFGLIRLFRLGPRWKFKGLEFYIKPMCCGLRMLRRKHRTYTDVDADRVALARNRGRFAHKPSSAIFVFRIRLMSRTSLCPAELVLITRFRIVSIWMLHMRSERRMPRQLGNDMFDVCSMA